MTELSMTRGRDIELSVDGEALCGVTHMSAESRYPRRRMYEYLSAEPCAEIADGESHRIILTVLSIFGGMIPQSGSFTLSAVDGDTEYRYEGCTVVQLERNIEGEKTVTDRYTLTALRMTKRRNDDVG